MRVTNEEDSRLSLSSALAWTHGRLFRPRTYSSTVPYRAEYRVPASGSLRGPTPSNDRRARRISTVDGEAVYHRASCHHNRARKTWFGLEQAPTMTRGKLSKPAHDLVETRAEAHYPSLAQAFP